MCTGVDQLQGSNADSLHQRHQEYDLPDLLPHVSQVVFTDLFPVFDVRGRGGGREGSWDIVTCCSTAARPTARHGDAELATMRVELHGKRDEDDEKNVRGCGCWEVRQGREEEFQAEGYE